MPNRRLAIVILLVLVVAVLLTLWTVESSLWQSADQTITIPQSPSPSIPPIRTLAPAVAVPMITGIVVDQAGHPIANARIYATETTKNNHSVHTDASGRFAIPAEGSIAIPLTTVAIGFVPDTRQLTGPAFKQPVRVVLARGQPLTGRVLDAAGNPIPNAGVRWRHWRGLYVMNLTMRTKTDAQGKFSLPNVPQDLAEYMITAAGYPDSPTNLKVQPGGVTVTLTHINSAATRAH